MRLKLRRDCRLLSGGMWQSPGVLTLLQQTKQQLANPNGSDPLCRYPARYGRIASLYSILLSYHKITSSRSGAQENKRRMRRKSRSMPASSHCSQHSPVSALMDESLVQTRRQTRLGALPLEPASTCGLCHCPQVGLGRGRTHLCLKRNLLGN